MPVYFIHSSQVVDRRIVIEDRLAHHLCSVLRIQKGETLFLVDERPKRYTGRVIESDRLRLMVEIVGEEDPPLFLRPFLHLGVGLLKGEKIDWVLQKATELGAARISFLTTKRTVIQPKQERAARQHDRWAGITLEAAQQSSRWTVPEVDPVLPLDDFLAVTAHYGLKFAFWEGAAAESLPMAIRSVLGAAPREGALLIGPEGGWEKGEVEAAGRAGFHPLSLGTTILRAETAALAALAILQYEIQRRSSGD
ncbi:MAG: RsmE family RNA methyltransferase [Candidatus Manganitrophaceae bacterium]